MGQLLQSQCNFRIESVVRQISRAYLTDKQLLRHPPALTERTVTQIWVILDIPIGAISWSPKVTIIMATLEERQNGNLTNIL